MTFSELRHKPVVSMADGLKVGEVDDLVIDPTRWTVSELYVAGKAGRGLLAFVAVKGIGKDALTIERSDLVAHGASSAGLCFADLKDRHVVDGTGTRRGHIDEVQIGSNGAVESFRVSLGGVFGIGAHHIVVTPAEVRGLGDKIVTIELPSEA